MFGTITFFVMIFFPLGCIGTGIKLRVTPYKVVTTGMLYSVMGALIVSAFMYALGNGAGAELSQMVSQMTNDLVSNESYLEMLGLKNTGKAEALAYVTEVYTTSLKMMPAGLFVWGGVVAYVEYAIMYRILRRKNPDVLKMTPVREFNMNRNAFLGWFVIYGLAWILSVSISSDLMGAVYMNVYALCRLAFAYQGISLIAFLFHMKRLPKAAWLIVVVLLMASGLGMMILYILGLVDAVLSLKSKVRGR